MRVARASSPAGGAGSAEGGDAGLAARNPPASFTVADAAAVDAI